MHGKWLLITVHFIFYRNINSNGCKQFYLTKDGDSIDAIGTERKLSHSQLRYLNPDANLKNLTEGVNLCVDDADVVAEKRSRCASYDPIGSDIESVSENFPWIVHIRAQDPAPDTGNMESQYCTGTLLNERAVLTTRTCVTNDPNKGTMRAAENHGVALAVDKIKGFGIDYTPVEKIFPGNHFKIAGQDIAILQLKEPLKASEFVHLLDPKTGSMCQETRGTLAGWDPYATEDGVTLQLVNGAVMEHNRGCRGYYLENNVKPENITDNILCADLDKVIHACDGYVGSPLLVHDKASDNYIQIGIATCENINPVYVNIRKHLPWIQEILKKIKI